MREQRSNLEFRGIYSTELVLREHEQEYDSALRLTGPKLESAYALRSPLFVATAGLI